MLVRVYRPAKQGGPLPMFLECHGGGMALMDGTETLCTQGYHYAASQGCIMVCPQFTNCSAEPFPRGLNDCYGTLEWALSKRKELNASEQVVLTGASGGGNLSIACAIKAKRAGLEGLKGLYTIIPYIYGLYGTAQAERDCPSQRQNDGIGGMDTKMMQWLAKLYHEDHDPKDPLAWPYWAKEDDVKGLVPTRVVVHECDPLRDEGISFYRKLRKAGVDASLLSEGGIPHGGTGWTKLGPHIVRRMQLSIQDSIAFARSL